MIPGTYETLVNVVGDPSSITDVLTSGRGLEPVATLGGVIAQDFHLFTHLL